MPTVPQRYRQTDGRLTIAIPRFALRASRGKNKTWRTKVKRVICPWKIFCGCPLLENADCPADFVMSSETSTTCRKCDVVFNLAVYMHCAKLVSSKAVLAIFATFSLRLRRKHNLFTFDMKCDDWENPFRHFLAVYGHRCNRPKQDL